MASKNDKDAVDVSSGNVFKDLGLAKRGRETNQSAAGTRDERLMNCLTALHHDVEIRIRAKPGTRKAGRILVTVSSQG